MRILLIQPEYQIAGFGFRLAAMPEPLHLEILAASVSDHEVRILDMRLDGDLHGTLERFQPDLVAVTALTTEVYAAREVLQAVKAHSADVFTVVGGHHATLMPEDFQISAIDAIGLGEGEMVFPALVAAVAAGGDLRDVPNLLWQDREGQFVANRRSIATCRSLDELPLPRRDLVADYRQEYFFLFDKPDASVAASRGCPFRCNFCSVHEFYGGRTRQMSAERVMREIRDVETKHITFVDDNFMLDARREAELARRVLDEGIDKTFSMEARTDSIARHPELVEQWVQAGLYAVLLGLEGATQSALTRVNKSNRLDTNDEAIRILKDNGVIIWGAFIVDPQWEADDFKRLREYVDRKEITHTQFTVLTPLPGTELYRTMFDDLLTYDYTCFDTLHAVVPTRMDREEFYQHFAGLYQQTDVGPYFDLVSEGKLTIDDCRRGKRMLDAMSDWRNYLPNDPVLGSVRAEADTLPGAVRVAQPRPAD